MSSVLHIARRDAWDRAQAGGEYRGDTLDTQGFIHCSTGRQWTRPLRDLFGGEADLVLLQVDDAPLTSTLRYDVADPDDPGGELFPHVHAPIPASAVIAIEPIPVELTLGWRPMSFALARMTASARGSSADGVDEWRDRGWVVTTDPVALDRDTAWRYLAEESYWAKGRSREEFERILANSLVFALLDPAGAFAGMGRVVTDRTNMAYVADVFVLARHRGGRGAMLMRSLLEHPDLAGVRHWLLATRDAHNLYRRFGFEVIDDPRWMVRLPGSPS